MKKYLIGLLSVVILIPATAYLFAGPGCNRDNVCPTENVSQSRPANVTIAPGQGGSQRQSLHWVKRLTKEKRTQTPQEKSSIYQRDKARWRGTRALRNISIYRKPIVKPEETAKSKLEKFHEAIRKLREAKKLINRD